MTDAETYYRKMRLVTEFTVTEEHLKLLRRAYVGWDPCEFGAPAIDCKRPYGNSDVISDIGEILGYERVHWDPDDDGDYNETIADNFTQLHAEAAYRAPDRAGYGRVPSRPLCVQQVRPRLAPG